MEEKFDSALLAILQHQVQIKPFLDTVFGFLYRKTDFYKICRSPNDSYGFPEGVAALLAQQAFQKYEKLACENEIAVLNPNNITDDCPIAVNEEVVSTAFEDVKPSTDDVSDSYNGATRDNYRWSQTMTDVDIKINVPVTVKSGKQVNVNIKGTRLSASLVNGDGTSTELVNDKLRWKINCEKSLWTLVCREYIHVNLEKAEERWWDSVLEGEERINLNEIDPSRPLSELDQDSQDKVNELLYNERQKCLGKLTTDQMKMQRVLKNSWDKDGSPFQGRPFDPSIVDFSGATEA